MKLLFRQPRSIAVRLITAVLAVEMLASLAAIGLSLVYQHHVHFRLLEIQLRGRADSVLGAVQDADDPGDNVMLDLADMNPPHNDLWEVFDDRQRLLGRSANWPPEPHGLLASTAAELATHHNAEFSNQKLFGKRYRFLLRQSTRTVDPGVPGGSTQRHITVLYGTPTDRVSHAVLESVRPYAITSLLLLIITGPLIAWLLHCGLEPLRQLAAISKHISANEWQFSPPPLARETPELAPLTQALESALDRLHRSFDQQSIFVSDAAHEFKTAVAVVKSSLQLLTLVERSPEAYREGIERALSDVERLEQLIARSLTLARTERAPVTAAPMPLSNLADAVEATAEELASMAELRQVEVLVGIAQGGPFQVQMSTEDARLLVSNLLANAIEHSTAHATVQLLLTVPGSFVELTVEDQGEGIAPEALPHIFDRFYRGDASRARTTGGAGLGLSIVKALVTRAGGYIEVVSRLAEGTIVIVRLPIASDAEPDTQ